MNLVQRPGLRLCIALLLWASGSWLPVSAKDPEGDISLSFANADINLVIRAISKIANKNFLIDPRVKGTLTIVTNKPVTPYMAYQMLLSALRLQGFSVVEHNGIVKVVPEVDAKQHSTPFSRERSRLRGDQPITRVFSIKNESAVQLLPVVRPLVSPANSITAYANNNTLVVTDYAENIERIGQIIDAIDLPQGDVVVIPLQNASAIDLAPTISRLMGNTTTGDAADASQRVTIVADGRTNALLVRSENPSRISVVRQLCLSLDQAGTAGNIHVIYLKNADATKVAETLRAALSGEAEAANPNGGEAGGMSATYATDSRAAPAQSSASSPGQSPFGQASRNSPRGRGIVHADRATNALIITAPEAIYNNLRQVVEKLDRRRAQVFVEALIAEITADRAAEFGIQWQSANMPNAIAGKQTLFGGTNFTTGSSNILDLTLNPANAAAGLNLIVGKGSILLPGSTTPILNLTMLARFLESQSNTNILSTPSLTMLDNEEAKIVVGQNLPFITGQYANTGGGTTPGNPFQTIERHDVGLTLRIRPQISEGGAVLLQIFEESSSVVAGGAPSTTGPITNKRSVETVTLVDDGSIIALGGLVRDSYGSGVEQVPLLGDLPIIGQLFRYNNRQRSKTNLFIFLRPKILRDAESYQSLASDRYDYVIGQQRTLEARRTLLLDETPPPELPSRSPALPQPDAPTYQP